MRTLPQPIKVVDDFFELPELWRYYALKQDFTRDETSTWPGLRTNSLDNLNLSLFHTLAGKIIPHIHGKDKFVHLKVNFAITDGSYNLGWLHQDEPQYNVAGLIYLTPDAPMGTGTSFYNKVANTDQNFNSVFFDELQSQPEDRIAFEKYKLDQRSLFIKNMTVENVFNRCVLFSPDVWHGADRYFGSTKEDSRLTLTFFGLAV